jgi:hypothetical protein
MSPTGRDLLIAGSAFIAIAASAGAVAAQTGQSSGDTPQADSIGRPDPTQDPRSTGSVGRSGAPLSDKLDSTDGVIRPPHNIAPDMSVQPPTLSQGTMRIIPPPGSPGGNPTIDPK